MRAGRSVVNLDFTFDLFICVAILTMYSKDICRATDAANIYGTLNRYASVGSYVHVYCQGLIDPKPEYFEG